MSRGTDATNLTQRSLRRAASRLAARDRDLRRVLVAHGPPPMWARKPGFRTLIQIILEPRGIEAEALGGLMVLGGLIVIVVVLLEARASRRSAY